MIMAIVEFFILIPNLEFWTLPHGFLSLSLMILTIIMAIVIPPLEYRYRKYDITQDEIYIERGILTRVKTIAPFNRIQHIDLRQGVLERIFGLASLIIFTAGTRGPELVLPGLPLPYAEMLRDNLRERVISEPI
jgi:membrane protein YdbS with pleckstrin-like domain